MRHAVGLVSSGGDFQMPRIDSGIFRQRTAFFGNPFVITHEYKLAVVA
jgi:hypothetical protein